MWIILIRTIAFVCIIVWECVFQECIKQRGLKDIPVPRVVMRLAV